jgi:hypothetical protein
LSFRWLGASKVTQETSKGDNQSFCHSPLHLLNPWKENKFTCLRRSNALTECEEKKSPCQSAPIEHFGPMLCSCVFSYSYSASRYSYSYSYSIDRFE